MPPRRKTRRRQRGAAFLGEGAYGMVYRPPLECDPANALANEYRTNRYVGKYTSKRKAYEEKKRSNLTRILNANRRFTVPINAICKVAAEQANTNFSARPNYTMQIVSEFRGTSVEKLIPDEDVLNDSTTYRHLTEEDITNLFQGLRAIKNLAPNLYIFNEHFVHNDLHFGNIVWDGEQARILDFGELETVRQAARRLQSMYPDLSLEEAIEEAKSIDIVKLFGFVVDIIKTKFIQERYKDMFRAWQFGNPTRFRSRDTYYERLAALPV